jgi:hypothetical protein
MIGPAGFTPQEKHCICYDTAAGLFRIPVKAEAKA